MIGEEHRHEGGMKKLQAQQRVCEELLCPLTEASEGLPDPAAITWASFRSLASAETPCQPTWDQCRAGRPMPSQETSLSEMLTSPVLSTNIQCGPPVRSSRGHRLGHSLAAQVHGPMALWAVV